MAIITRWRSPPESWCGILAEPHARRGDADAAEQLRRAVRAPRARRRRDGGAAPRPSASRPCRPGSGWSSAPGRSSPSGRRAAAPCGVRERAAGPRRRRRRRSALRRAPRGQQAHHRERRHRLAAAGFAHEAMRLAACRRSKRGAAHGVRCGRRTSTAQALDVQQRLAVISVLMRVPRRRARRAARRRAG